MHRAGASRREFGRPAGRPSAGLLAQGFGRPAPRGLPPSRGYTSQSSSRSSITPPSPAPLGQARSRSPFRGPAAGHSAYPAHPLSTLARCGQLNRNDSELSIMTQGQFLPLFAAPWNGRTPVAERQIPAWEGSAARFQRMQRMPRLNERPATVSGEYTLLMSPRSSVERITRPWPEYLPEASAPIGRRWEGTCLGRLHEHKPTSRVHAFPTYTPRL